MGERLTADLVVVGNGVIGLSVAVEFLRRSPDATVLVVGPSERPGAASAAAGAMLGCFGEVTKDTLATPQGRARFEIGVAAHRAWPARIDELAGLAESAGEQLHQVHGTHVILNSRSGTLDSLNFDAVIRALVEYDEPWQEVDARDIPGLNPLADARPLRALHLPTEGGVDSAQVLRLLERQIAALGGRLIDGEVASITTVDGAAAAVILASGAAVDAGSIVVAAGASTASVLRTALDAHRVLPMFAGSGIAFVGRRVLGAPFSSVVRTPSRSAGCGLHLVPLSDGREYVGATNVVFAEPELGPYLGVGHFLAGCAMEELDQKIFFHRIDAWRMGNRPVSLDGFPVIGFTDVAGLYCLGGTYRDGFHSSQQLARHAVDELHGGSGVFDHPFEPQRSPIAVRSIDFRSSSGWSCSRTCSSNGCARCTASSASSLRSLPRS
jgi:glycine oxidase